MKKQNIAERATRTSTISRHTVQQANIAGVPRTPSHKHAAISRDPDTFAFKHSTVWMQKVLLRRSPIPLHLSPSLPLTQNPFYSPTNSATHLSPPYTRATLLRPAPPLTDPRAWSSDWLYRAFLFLNEMLVDLIESIFLPGLNQPACFIVSNKHFYYTSFITFLHAKTWVNTQLSKKIRETWVTILTNVRVGIIFRIWISENLQIATYLQPLHYTHELNRPNSNARKLLAPTLPLFINRSFVKYCRALKAGPVELKSWMRGGHSLSHLATY